MVLTTVIMSSNLSAITARNPLKMTRVSKYDTASIFRLTIKLSN
jgi:hypothetical protein